MKKLPNPGCEGKVKFATWSLAAGAARQRAFGHDRLKGRVAYHCSACGSYHLGRQLGGGKVGRRPRVEDPELA